MSVDCVGPIHPVILCGGSGSRLWPLSRSLHPKQLLPIASFETMLQSTVNRARGETFAAPIVVAGEQYAFLIRDQLRDAGAEPDVIIVEPEPRNTAAAIALAALRLSAHDPDAVMLVMPSDHVIEDSNAFMRTVLSALPEAKSGRLVTFGIRPRAPATGYGYIEGGDRREGHPGALEVRRFVEKPDEATARTFCESGAFYWNAGIFLFRANAFLDELEQFEPEIAKACASAVAESTQDGPFVRPGAKPFAAAPSKSIDYAVMERTQHASVLPTELAWSDVGSWNALWEIGSKDSNGNVLRGDVIGLDVVDSLIRSEPGMTVAAVGIEGLIIVATRDAVLVVPRERSEDTKQVVERLKEGGGSKHVMHPHVQEAWGSFEVLDASRRFESRRIIVDPGQELLVETGSGPSAHWIVVEGTARVTIEGEIKLLGTGESAFVPAGATRGLANPGDEPIKVIQVAAI